MVEDGEGNTFDVSLKGELIRETQRGFLYEIDGEFDGNDLEYELYYIGFVKKKTADIE